MIYIFDFDGTLIDSMPKWTRQFINIVESEGIKCPDDFVKTITPLGNRGTAEYCTTLGVKKSVDEILEIVDGNLYREYAEIIPAKEEVIDTLNELKKRGDRLVVLTACPHVRLDVCLKRLGIYDIFEKVWSCDDFPYTKSQPEIYKETAERLGVTVGECIFLDDNYDAVSAAAKSGMQTAAVYDETSADYEQDMRKISDRYIYKFSELL